MGRSRAFPPSFGHGQVDRRRRNASGQQKHPARRRGSRLPSRLSGNISPCDRRGFWSTRCDPDCVETTVYTLGRWKTPSTKYTRPTKAPRSTPSFSPAKSPQWEQLAVRSQRVVHYDLRPCMRHETTMPALQKRNTIIIAAAQPTLGSAERRVSSGETAQACTARHQGGHWYHSYALIPRGLRCGPCSGQ